MKKSIFFAAAVLLAVGCQKSELLDTTQEQKMITHTFSVDDEATKSLYDPSDGYVKLDKTESIAVGYTNADISKYVVSNPNATTKEKFPVIAGIVEAKRNENSYTFSHNAIDGATGYNYYFLMPYRSTSNISTNGTKTSWYAKIDAVQHPTATSFDPLQDYILGEAVLNVEEQQSAITSKNLKLKRLFALVRVTLRDSKEEFGGEPLMSVSMGFPLTENPDKKNNLVSLAYLRSIAPDTGELLNFANAGLNGYADVTTPHVSPTVTAEYSNGLAMEEGTYTVWYVTMPVEKAKGTVLTVTAQSKNRKVTREIALPSDIKLKAGVINDLKINITGEGYVAEDAVDPNDYWSIYNAGQDIVAGGMTINKSSHENATLLSGDQITNDDLQKGGLIFVEGNFSSTKHLKLAKGSIIIGRYKDSQPSITMNSDHTIYLDKGDLVLKNLNIGGSTTADRLFVISGDDGNETSDYAVIEDCTITANKKVCAYAYQGKDKNPNYGHAYYVIKSLTFDNCIIKMAGTSQNNMVIMLPKHVNGSYDAYKDITKLEISNCVIYADAPFTSTTSSKNRRQLMDLGNSGAGYQLPLENATIIAKNNTLYNINANGNQLIRAYSAYATDISGNVMYNDYASTPDGTFTATTVLQLNAANPSQGGYKVQSNYSYGYFTSEQTTNKVKWTNGSAVTYTTGSNNQDLGQEQDRPFTTADMTKGYFPVNSANIQKATGASYETKPWVK